MTTARLGVETLKWGSIFTGKSCKLIEMSETKFCEPTLSITCMNTNRCSETTCPLEKLKLIVGATDIPQTFWTPKNKLPML